MLIEEWSLSGDKGLVGVIYMETWGGGGGNQTTLLLKKGLSLLKVCLCGMQWGRFQKNSLKERGGRLTQVVFLQGFYCNKKEISCGFN